MWMPQWSGIAIYHGHHVGWKRSICAKLDKAARAEGIPQNHLVPLEWTPETASNMLKKVRRSTRPTVISIEGIPGSRKSDIIEALAEVYSESEEVVVIQEPTTNSRLLEVFMKHPQKYGFAFQVYYFLLMERNIRHTIVKNLAKRVIICERSLLSAKHVYSPLLGDALSRVEQEVYETLFEEGGVRYAMPDEVAYLNENIEKAIQRIENHQDKRERNLITREYLEKCQVLHNQPAMSTDNGFTEVIIDSEGIESTLRDLEEIIGKAKGVEIEIFPTRPSLPRIVSIEGNVGAGKSTLLRSIKKRLDEEGRKDIVVLEEPIDEWVRVTDGKDNLMQLFYETPRRYAFTFQTLVTITTMRAIRRVVDENPIVKVILCERSLLSSRHVFAEALKDEGAISEIEMLVYDEFFNEEGDSWMHPEEVIYLDTSPEICLERIKLRDRPEEEHLDVEWLRKYQGYYMRALYEKENKVPVIIEGDISNLDIRKEWIDRVVGRCEDLGGISNQNMPGERIGKDIEEGKEDGTTETLSEEPKEEGIPIKVRFGDQVWKIGKEGDTLHQLEENIWQHFPGMKGSRIRIKWRRTMGGQWFPIDNEEELVAAMETIQRQGRPVARLVMEWDNC
jgi:deoxyadenosine/deoxycytidine kinase